jgi:hypothetical protein
MSAAPPLSNSETQYIQTSYRQIIQELGQNITYEQLTSSGTDQYNNPILTFSNLTILGVVTEITRNEYIYIEPGLEPAHYAHLYEYQVVPNMLDRILWQGIEWTIRHFMPITIGGTVAYYDIMLRRLA